MPLFLQPFAKYADFSGRARRAEYWWFYLAQVVVYLLVVAFAVTGESLESGLSILLVGCGLFALVSLLPNLALIVRRLHDTNRSALWLLLYLPGFVSAFIAGTEAAANQGIPAVNPLFSVLGAIANFAMLAFMGMPGTSGPNRFGDDPKGGRDISHVFDAPETEPAFHEDEAAPHKPVFDFGPTPKSVIVPVPDLPQPPVPMRPATGFAAPARPVFGKRGRVA
jgi:uncharacterized membrane protein YhaH (DUF805 family)